MTNKMSQLSLTEQLTHQIYNKNISQRDLDKAALFALDGLANAIAGQNSVPGKKLLAWKKSQGNDAGRSAFLIGALTHILELDDLHRASVVHPACVVIPAAYTVAQREGASGALFLQAILWGFEAACRVGMAVGSSHYRIWHNTATCGPFGSAMATAHLLGLDEAATVNALGNAGTQAAGLWQFLETGAMTKHLHAGRAAESGIIAADLAKLGFTGPPKILEGEKGFFAAACPNAIPNNVVKDPQGDWQLHQTSIKPWPCCRHTHAVIDVALKLREKCNIDDIDNIEIHVYQAALDVCTRPEPGSQYEAKFSLHHTAAIALITGRVNLASFDEASRKLSHTLHHRMKLILNPGIDQAYPLAFGAEVRINLLGGEQLALHCHDAKGDPEAPLGIDEMVAKADILLRHGGMNNPAPFIEAVLATAKGGAIPKLPPALC